MENNDGGVRQEVRRLLHEYNGLAMIDDLQLPPQDPAERHAWGARQDHMAEIRLKCDELGYRFALYFDKDTGCDRSCAIATQNEQDRIYDLASEREVARYALTWRRDHE